MTRSGGVRSGCAALMAVMGVALGISGAYADDLVGSEQIGASDADDAASMASDRGGRVLWSRQPGTSASDVAAGAATDRKGNVYVVGNTAGALGGPNKGNSDGWVIKFDSDGRRLWSRQPGTSSEDFANDASTDRNGKVYVVGSTAGALGGAHQGGEDAWLIKFDSDGHRLWSRQPGTSDRDFANGVATDTDGNVYVVGWTEGALGGPYKGGTDAWVIKFDSDGDVLWSRQPGTSEQDFANGVATDTDGNVFVVGSTGGALGGAHQGGEDAWLIKFDSDGDVLWSRQPGTSEQDAADGVATDTDGNVTVVGLTLGALGGPFGGVSDAWVFKFDGDGDVLWSRQPGTTDEDRALGVATDRDGNASVVGLTRGALGGPYKGNNDAWVIKFDGDGDVLWRRQPGTSTDDVAIDVATDTHGNVYVVGDTSGALGGPHRGDSDGWIIKYSR